jgi:hypothetical protein
MQYLWLCFWNRIELGSGAFLCLLDSTHPLLPFTGLLEVGSVKSLISSDANFLIQPRCHSQIPSRIRMEFHSHPKFAARTFLVFPTSEKLAHMSLPLLFDW